MLTRMRIWLPDAPGILGAVAAEIGAVNGNVIGLEVLEREAGVAIDELVVELPDEPGAVEAACRGVRNVPGAGVEEVTELMTEAKDREDTVLAAAASILQAATATAAMNALTGHLIALFDLTWLALADEDLAGFVEMYGDVPSAAVGCRLCGGLAQRCRSGERHHGLGRVRRARRRDGLHRLRWAPRPHQTAGAPRDRAARDGGVALHRCAGGAGRRRAGDRIRRARVNFVNRPTN